MSDILMKNNTILSFLLFISLFSNAINVEKFENKKTIPNFTITTPSHQINLQDSTSIKNSYTNNFLKFDLLSETNAKSRYKSYKMAIKMNALIVTGTISPAFEYKFSKHFSGQIQLIGVYQPKGFILTKKPLSLFSILIEPRYYPKKTFEGFFLGLDVGFSAFNMARAIIINNWPESFNSVDHKGWNIMGGLSLGWTFPVGDNFGIEPFITTGFTYSTWDNYITNTLVTATPKTRLDFVYAYNGGINIVYKFGPDNTGRSSYGPKRPVFQPKGTVHRGSKYNRNIYRKIKNKRR